MAHAQKALADLETPIADILTMASIIADLIEDPLQGAPETDGYYRISAAKADQLLWAIYDTISRTRQLQQDWNAANDAAFHGKKEAIQ